MTRRWLRRITSDSGFSLPEVIASVLVNMVAIGIIATSVITFTVLQMNLAAAGGGIGASALVDNQWRSTVEQASAMTVTDSSKVSFTSHTDTECTSAEWVLAGGGLDVITARYPIAESGADGCSATPDTAKTQTLIPRVSGGAFLFQNEAGRAMEFTGGVPILAAGTAPDGVTDTAWESTVVALATFRAQVLNSNVTTALTSTQATNQLRRADGRTDAPSSFVPAVTP